MQRLLYTLLLAVALAGVALAGNAVSGYTVAATYDDGASLDLGSDSDVRIFGGSRTLTDGVLTTVFTVASSDGTTWSGELFYTIYGSNATPQYHALTGQAMLSFVDRSTGVVVTDAGVDTALAATVGVTTNVWTISATDDGSIEVQVNANCDRTSPTVSIRWVLIVNASSANTITVP